MVKKRRLIIISAVAVAIVITVAGLFMFQKFMNHESNQSDRISLLEARLGMMEQKAELPEKSNAKIWSGGGTTI